MLSKARRLVQALEGSRLLASRRGQARCSGSHCVHSEQLLSSSHQLLNVSRSTVQLTTCTRACRGFCKPGFAFQPSTEVAEVDIVRHAGVDLLHDPLHNKVYPAHTLAYALCDAGDAALGFKGRPLRTGNSIPSFGAGALAAARPAPAADTANGRAGAARPERSRLCWRQQTLQGADASAGGRPNR